jgi:hypothetical protein
MINFQIDSVMSELRKAVVNEDMGVEKMSSYYLHESLATQYLKATLASTEAALRKALGIENPDPGSKSGK